VLRDELHILGWDDAHRKGVTLRQITLVSFLHSHSAHIVPYTFAVIPDATFIRTIGQLLSTKTRLEVTRTGPLISPEGGEVGGLIDGRKHITRPAIFEQILFGLALGETILSACVAVFAVIATLCLVGRR